MLEDLRIDSHKLIFHPQRVCDWLDGKNIYPLTVEIAPAGTCNHRCIFCGLDFMGYKPHFLDKNLIIANLAQMQAKGVKAIVLAGEGEPLLNRHTPEIVTRSREIGLDVSMSTNGVLFTREVAQECLPSLTWLRFSVNASNPENYRLVHSSRSGDFNQVMQNLGEAVEIKRSNNLRTTIGVQLVLLPENSQGLVAFAEKLKEIGVDYFSIKPFSQHPQSICSLDQGFDYEEYFDLSARLTELATEEFQIIFRIHAMKKLKNARQYQRCLGLPFFAYIDSQANIFPCVVFLGKDDFSFGNLKEHDFATIWEGERRHKLMEYLNQMDVSSCRELCRLDEINLYLDRLKYPGAHVNFI